MSSPHQHSGGRRSGEQGDGTLVLGHIASGQPEGAQPRVAVTGVLCDRRLIYIHTSCLQKKYLPNFKSVEIKLPDAVVANPIGASLEMFCLPKDSRKSLSSSLLKCKSDCVFLSDLFLRLPAHPASMD